MRDPDNRPRPASRVTEVDLNAFDLIMEHGYGVTSNLAVATLVSCGEGTVSRIREGKQKPGGAFISGVGGVVTPDEFFQIFNFKDADRKVPVAA